MNLKRMMRWLLITTEVAQNNVVTQTTVLPQNVELATDVALNLGLDKMVVEGNEVEMWKKHLAINQRRL